MSDRVTGTITKRIPITGALSPKSPLNISGSLRSSGGGTKDYDQLINKPSLNGVTIEGSRVSEDYYLPKVIFDTTENWATRGLEISEKNTVYVWTDYMETEDGMIVGVKVGDGSAYIIDLPFTDKILQDHIHDDIRHITQAEREFWNSKNRAVAYGENLILTES